MTAQKYSLRPLIELLFSTALWGLGFPATAWILKNLDPASNLFYRLQFCFWLSAGIILLSKHKGLFNLANLRLGLIPGFFLGLNLLLQTVGLQYTSPTKSAFITVLYVVMVPIIELAFHRQYISKKLLIAILGALIGVYFVSQIQDFNLNIGDVLTLLCALAAAFQIYFVGKISRKSNAAFTLNAFQSLVASVLMVPFMFFEDKTNLMSLDTGGWLAFVLTVVGGSMIAFYLQIKAQQQISASTAGVLFLLESPFAFLFSFMIFGETLTLSQLLGCILILVSCTYAIL